MHHLLTPAWIAKHLFALIILVAMIQLGFWQLDRLEQRRALNASLIAASEGPATTLTGEPIDPAEFHFRRVRVTGVYDNAESIVLRNQTLEGVSGVHLLTPLRISGSDQAVLVDRGWLPEDRRQPEDLLPFTETDAVTIEGVARRSQSRPESALAPLDLPLPGETRIHAWVRVDIPRIEEQVGYDLLPIFIEQSAHTAGTDNSLPRPRSLAALDEGPHLGYAIQWFTFSAILMVVYTLLLRQELRKHMHGSK